jgi:hypothetical protein
MPIEDVWGLQAALDDRLKADDPRLQAALEEKSPTDHGHLAATTEAPGFMSVADKIKLDSLNETFISSVAGLSQALDDKAAIGHGHGIDAVTGLQTALDGKAAAGHGHGIDAVTGLQTALDGKAAAGHGHAIANVTGLQAELDGKAAAGHGHAIANVTGLQTALDGKAATGDLFLGLEGLTLSRNSANPGTRIDIAPGRAVVERSSGRFVAITTGTITKRLDAAWVTGSGNGGRFSGTVGANQWWYVFQMANLSGSVEYGFDTSPTGANKPTGWSVRRIGAIRTDASGNIRDFVQNGNKFYWASEIEDFRGAIGTTAALYTISVPPGIGVEAIVRLAAGLPTAGNTNAILLSSPLVSDQVPGRLGSGSATAESVLYTGNFPEYTQSAVEQIFTTTGQIRARASFGSYSNNPRIATIGWIDTRS